MDNFDIGQLTVTIVLAAAPWMFPGLARTYQILILLVVIAFSSIVAYLKLRKKYAELESSFKDVSQKHHALSEQFKEKQDEIKHYQESFAAVESLIMVTAQSTKQDRLSTMASYFEKIKYGLFGSGKESK